MLNCLLSKRTSNQKRVVQMNNRRTLSIAPYFGGKGRMAHFIADRLDYANTDIFVTPFGGMCRELLNKPRHKVECYNDYSSSLCALMRVLSKPKDADEFIHRLYDETAYNEELFNRYKRIYDSAETDLERQAREALRRLLIDEGKVSPHVAGSFLDRLIENIHGTDLAIDDMIEKYRAEKDLAEKGLIEKAMTEEELDKAINETINDAMNNAIKNTPEVFTQVLSGNSGFKSKFEKSFLDWLRLYEQKEREGFLPRPTDMGIDISDIDLAIATYVVFTQSRDGMGKAWSKGKFNDPEQYKKRILRLYDCAERLEGIEVYQIDALDFFRRAVTGKNLSPLDYVMNEWISSPDVMMYCDPSYISPESEQEILARLNNNSGSSSSSTEKKKREQKPKNLGKVYAMSFDYKDQEKFLECIQYAKCKMMISNYDLQLYNKYLNPSTGWRREEFQTTTSVGGKAGNTRTEVIWYNY